MKFSSFKQPQRPERLPVAWPGPQRFATAARCEGHGTPQPKPMEHRNPALLAMARGKRCLFQIPGICNNDPRTTVACHENQGKGMGIKASDARSAQGCSACHEAYDRGPALREVKRAWFHVAHGRQIFEWQRVVGDLSEPPRNRRAAHWALLLESEPNPPPALDTRAQLAINSGANMQKQQGYIDWVVVLIILVTLGLIWLMVHRAMVDAREWEKFKAAHACKVVAQVPGETFNTIGFGASGAAVIGIGSTSAKTGWLCDDGITYYK